MKLNKLPKTTKRKKKRLGRGYGSGKGGHTVGRGAKGFKARSRVSLVFEGTKTKKSFLKRLPLQRGKGKFKPSKSKPLVVNVKYLNLYKKGEKVNLMTLVEKGIIVDEEAKKQGVKILGDGDLRVALTVELPASKGATEKIIKAGGKVIEVKEKIALKKKEKQLKTKKKRK